jgi:hypothetical protein
MLRGSVSDVECLAFPSRAMISASAHGVLERLRRQVRSIVIVVVSTTLVLIAHRKHSGPFRLTTLMQWKASRGGLGKLQGAASRGMYLKREYLHAAMGQEKQPNTADTKARRMMEERKSRYELFLEEEARKARPTKRCSRCKKAKALSEFWKDRSAKSGVVSACKACMTAGDPQHKYKDREDRFWKTYHSKTRRVGDCIEWTGGFSGKSKKGNPICSWNGKNTMIRRVVYKLSVGELLDENRVITTCGNKWCVRASHLKSVTPVEAEAHWRNSASTGDCHGSHTHPERRPRGDNHPRRLNPERFIVLRGEGHGMSKLNDDVVRNIRNLNRDGMSIRAIARKIGVSHPTIQYVLCGKTWAHVE